MSYLHSSSSSSPSPSHTTHQSSNDYNLNLSLEPVRSPRRRRDGSFRLPFVQTIQDQRSSSSVSSFLLLIFHSIHSAMGQFIGTIQVLGSPSILKPSSLSSYPGFHTSISEISTYVDTVKSVRNKFDPRLFTLASCSHASPLLRSLHLSQPNRDHLNRFRFPSRSRFPNRRRGHNQSNPSRSR